MRIDAVGPRHLVVRSSSTGRPEGALGLTCYWQDLPDRARSKILAKEYGGFRDEQERADLRSWAVATTEPFADVFPRYLENEAPTVAPPESIGDRRRLPDTDPSPSLVKEYEDYRDEQEQDRRSTWDVTERPALEHFAALVPLELWSRSGSVFYSGRDAFGGPASAYLLGLNPCGDPNRRDGTTIRSDTEWVVNAAPANWSRYRDESWEGATRGSWGMQPRFFHLLNRLSLDPGKVPASNLVFPRSRQEQGIMDELRVLAEVCWPFHRAVIERPLGLLSRQERDRALRAGLAPPEGLTTSRLGTIALPRWPPVAVRWVLGAAGSYALGPP